MSSQVASHSRLRTGTVSFLFTDIEGSTTLWEQFPDAMQAALARHDRLLRHAIESSSGCIVKGTGDGVYAVFAVAADALAACLAAQRALAAPELCNLGMVYDGLGHLNDAQDHFEAALVIARELGDLRSEGQFLSYLGLLHARQGRFDEARRCLDSSEALLRAASDRMSLGILLCGRAAAEHLAGAPGDAKAALAEADAIAAEVKAGPNSELGLALARVRNLGHEES